MNTQNIENIPTEEKSTTILQGASLDVVAKMSAESMKNLQEGTSSKAKTPADKMNERERA